MSRRQLQSCRQKRKYRKNYFLWAYGSQWYQSSLIYVGIERDVTNTGVLLFAPGEMPPPPPTNPLLVFAILVAVVAATTV